MKTIERRLSRLEGAGYGVSGLSDADLDRGIELLLAKLGGRVLSANETAEYEAIRRMYRRDPLPLRDEELDAMLRSILPAALMIAGGMRLGDLPDEARALLFRGG